MGQTPWQWLNAIAGWRNVGLALALWLALAGFNLALQLRFRRMTGGLEFLDFQFGAEPPELVALVKTYGVEARRLHLWFAAFGFAYAFSAYLLGVLLLSVLIRELRVATTPWRWLVLIPVAGLVVEWSENLSLATLLALFPQSPQPVAWLVSHLIRVKFALIALLAISILALALSCVIARARGSPRT